MDSTTRVEYVVLVQWNPGELFEVTTPNAEPITDESEMMRHRAQLKDTFGDEINIMLIKRTTTVTEEVL